MMTSSLVCGISWASSSLWMVLPKFNSKLGKKVKSDEGPLLFLQFSPSNRVRASYSDWSLSPRLGVAMEHCHYYNKCCVP
jgi:hypothetical protein